MIWRGRDLGPISFESLALAGEPGRPWYSDSWRSIQDYAFRHELDASRVVDVLAILSPRVTVGYSVKLADEYLRTGGATGAMGQRMQALARYETSGKFNGPKVNAFADALRGDPAAVVVDAWIYRAAREHRTTPKAYREVTQRVQATAAKLDWPVAETQAAIWQGARAFVGFESNYSPMQLEGY